MIYSIIICNNESDEPINMKFRVWFPWRMGSKGMGTISRCYT